jgi:hypothetical protein
MVVPNAPGPTTQILELLVTAGAGHACPRRISAPALRRCYLKLAVTVMPKVRGAPNAYW